MNPIPTKTPRRPRPSAPPESPAIAGIVAPAPRVTFEEWFGAGGEGSLSEWVNGQVIVHMSATLRHQWVVDFLLILIGHFVYPRKMGRVFSAPAAMRPIPDGPGREPDLMFISTARLGIASGRYVEGAPDLVVEVVSDDSLSRDRDEKFSEYEAAGIREYWIIDPRPNRLRADFYVLDDAGRYGPKAAGPAGIYRSTAITGFWLNLNWLWDDEMDPMKAVREVAGGDIE